MGKIALVSGATGLVGSHLIDQLINNHHFQKIYSLQRRKTERSHSKLEEVIVDLDHLENLEIPSIDAAFCCLGTTMKNAGSKEQFRKVDYTYVINTAKKAKENGASVFCLVSAMGADSNSRFFYNQVKGEVETALREMGFDALHLFRPSMLLGNRKEFRFGEKVGIFLFKLLDPIMRGPLEKYRASHSDIVAQQMIEKALTITEGTHIWDAKYFTN
jgi:uncharacterized protein YbjT (DUF2867 family)